jgi:sugar phosphate isomerase/epimerase
MLVAHHPSLARGPAPGWQDSVRIAAAAGFDFIDLDLMEVADVDPGFLRESLEEANLQAWAASLPAAFREDQATFKESLEFLRRIAPLAASIGVRVMHRSLPASSDKPFSELEPLLQGRWSECAGILGAHGITAAIEPLGTPYRRQEGVNAFISRLDMAAEFAHGCGEHMGILVDSWHWYLAGDTAADIVQVGELVAHVHIADVPHLPEQALRDNERVLPGEGKVDFDIFRGALERIGYAGIVTPEIPGKWSESSSPIETSRRALEATVKVIGNG